MASKSSIKSTVRAAQRRAIVEHARSTPSVTLGELVTLEGELGELAASITVGELIRGGRRGKTPPMPLRIPLAIQAVDTRSARGRDAYDAAILSTLQSAKDRLSAKEIRKRCGGTPLQARVALQRLLDARKIRRYGKAAATKYASK